MRSKHKQVAYLIGTPVTSAKLVVIEIIVRNENNFQHAQRYLSIELVSNGTHSSSTKRIAQILIKNYDPEDFIYHSNGQELRKQLILSIHAFCKDNLTYIFNLLPAVTAPPEELITMGKQKFGTFVQIGTQKPEFHAKVENLAKGIEINPQHCKRAGAYQRDFLPTFDIDWCKFKVQPVIPLHSEMKKTQQLPITAPSSSVDESSLVKPDRLPFEIDDLSVTTRNVPYVGRHVHSVSDLTKEQLEEYVNVRESQQHLRNLSLHRQVFEPLLTRTNPATPLEQTSVGKQTVAEAAKACGSSLHMYRNPFDQESNDEEDEDEAENEESEATNEEQNLPLKLNQ
ncbi:unnamed protein product [Enterobius vermicularis]|uniref:C2 tensin-type domain-containing protein n=1 Tax=Enterobius vermicularis TaxID=51028 RepID=A0A0N4UTC5_ENTVE|nr:unnamed protein product [Enterobius vermicularis]